MVINEIRLDREWAIKFTLFCVFEEAKKSEYSGVFKKRDRNFDP
ncbi:hypothetical protein SAMN05444416_106127 [Thermoactinomyces sp. DSM 45892]|nr:hypothetical protein SAMN05444416_106127 [Thermoactinomyces sp. DSM 45892]